MENKMAIVHIYLSKHPSLFWFHTKKNGRNLHKYSFKNLAIKATKLIFSILNLQKCQILHQKNLWY
jgi:hypothetical protein